MSTNISKTSQYRDTKIDGFYLGIWEPIDIPTSLNDTTYTVRPDHENRPDLIAHEFLGNANLWWVIFLRNIETISDPLSDITTGKQIMIPAKNIIQEII